MPFAIALLLLLPAPTVKAASGSQRLLEERDTALRSYRASTDLAVQSAFAQERSAVEAAHAASVSTASGQAAAAVDKEYRDTLQHLGAAGTAALPAPLAQTPEGQEAMRVFNITESMLELARINGYPAKALRSKDEIEALKAGDEQAAQTQQLLTAAPILAQSLESAAKVQALGQGVA